MKKYPINESSILFEEPEAHLHPLKQIFIADLLVEMVMMGAFMQVTTHSDYIIRRLNDWIVMHKIKEKSVDIHKEICDKYGYDSSLVLDPSLINAYLLRKRDDGSVELALQDISNGIPFDSFHDVINEYVNKSYVLEMELDKL